MEAGDELVPDRFTALQHADPAGALEDHAGDVVVAADAGQPQLLPQLILDDVRPPQVVLEKAAVGHEQQRQVAEHRVRPRVATDDPEEALQGKERAQSDDAREQRRRVPEDDAALTAPSATAAAKSKFDIAASARWPTMRISTRNVR